MIPRRIFQTWKSKADIPDNFAYWSQTIREKNPTCEYHLWDDNDNHRFIAERFPWFLPIYDQYPMEIFRADAVRYFHLYEHGGLYADMDVECLNPLDQIFAIGGVVLGRMGTDEDFDSSIPNAIMFSEAREEFWLLVMSMMMTDAKKGGPEIATGSNLLRRAVLAYTGDYLSKFVQGRLAKIRAEMPKEQWDKHKKSSITLLPGKYLYPLNWNDRIHDLLLRRPLLREKRMLDPNTALSYFKGSFTVTYWTHSWGPQDLS